MFSVSCNESSDIFIPLVMFNPVNPVMQLIFSYLLIHIKQANISVGGNLKGSQTYIIGSNRGNSILEIIYLVLNHIFVPRSVPGSPAYQRRCFNTNRFYRGYANTPVGGSALLGRESK